MRLVSLIAITLAGTAFSSISLANSGQCSFNKTPVWGCGEGWDWVKVNVNAKNGEDWVINVEEQQEGYTVGPSSEYFVLSERNANSYNAKLIASNPLEIQFSGMGPAEIIYQVDLGNCQVEAEYNQPCEGDINWVRTRKPNAWCDEWGEWAQVKVTGSPNSTFKIKIEEGFLVKQTTSNKLGSDNIESMTAEWGNPHVFTGKLGSNGSYQFDYKVHWQNPDTCRGKTLSGTGVTTGKTEHVGGWGKTNIRPTPNNSERIIVAIKDDGLYNSTKLIIEWMKHFNIKGKIGDALHSNHFRTGAYNSSWEKYATLEKEGHLDVINHSQSGEVVSTNNMEKKIATSQKELELEFSNRGAPIDVLGFVFPQAKTSGDRDSIMKRLAETHFASKSLSYDDKKLNPLHPSDEQFLKLHQKRLNDETRSSDMIAMIDDLFNLNDGGDDGKFLLIAAHGCDPNVGSYSDDAKKVMEAVAKGRDVNQALSEWSQGFKPTPCNVWYDMFEHLKNGYDDSEYWFTGLTDVVRYVLESRYSKIETVSSSEIEIKLRASLTGKIKDQRNTLGETIFDMPLLVRTEVPSSWSSASIKYSGSNLTHAVVRSKFENGKNYIYYNLIPDGKTVTLTVN